MRNNVGRGKLVDDWIEGGLVLGALGGLAGLFTSGIVHYNLGDSEVIMIFYFIAGLALVVNRERMEEDAAHKLPLIHI